MAHQRVAFPDFKLRICSFLLCLVGIISASDLTATSSLNHTFYDMACPMALPTIKKLVTKAVSVEPRMGASLLRLHFHDCFVQGCDASILLNDTANFKGEQNAFPNNGSLKGFDVINNIKTAIENLCPHVVSCADILAVAARDSVVALGGIGWNVQLGRRDSTTANLTAANTDLPAPSLDLNGLITAFQKKNFTPDEMVALSGGHSIGKARCVTFRSRIYNERNINGSYAKLLQANCSATNGDGDSNLSPIDITTEYKFDNAYYNDLISLKGLFHSDQQLYNNGSTDSKVKAYAANATLFQLDFGKAMIKMGNLSPLTGNQGQIRKICSRVN